MAWESWDGASVAKKERGRRGEDSSRAYGVTQTQGIGFSTSDRADSVEARETNQGR